MLCFGRLERITLFPPNGLTIERGDPKRWNRFLCGDADTRLVEHQYWYTPTLEEDAFVSRDVWPEDVRGILDAARTLEPVKEITL